MKRPPFKVDGRVGRLRWVDRNGQPRAQSDRVAHLWGRTVPQQAIMGATQFEISLTVGKWHRVEMSAEEAAERLGSSFLTRGFLKSALSSRGQVGLPALDGQKAEEASR